MTCKWNEKQWNCIFKFDLNEFIGEIESLRFIICEFLWRASVNRWNEAKIIHNKCIIHHSRRKRIEEKEEEDKNSHIPKMMVSSIWIVFMNRSYDLQIQSYQIWVLNKKNYGDGKRTYSQPSVIRCRRRIVFFFVNNFSQWPTTSVSMLWFFQAVQIRLG